MKKTLFNYFSDNFELSSEEAGTIVSAFKPLTLEYRDHFLTQGQISNNVCFIVEGVMRSYSVDEEGNEVTHFFFNKCQFLTHLESYRTGKPSSINIQAVTDCRLLVTKKQNANNLPVWPELFQKLVQQTLLRKIADQRSLRDLSAHEKYEHFLETDGAILQRVPLKYVASYLGIAPQSLSRIRRAV